MFPEKNDFEKAYVWATAEVIPFVGTKLDGTEELDVAIQEDFVHLRAEGRVMSIPTSRIILVARRAEIVP
jgi:hypothetical protein